MQPTQTPKADDGLSKLAMVLAPLFAQQTKDLKDNQTLVTQELLLSIKGIETQIQILEKLVSEKKKPLSRQKVTTDAIPVGLPDEVNNNKPTTSVFNKLVYFRDQYKNNTNFRNKYATAEIQELMSKDATIQEKKTDAAKLTAQATFCWNYIKQYKPELMSAYEAEFAAAKKASETTSKQPQQEAEGRTPPGGN